MRNGAKVCRRISVNLVDLVKSFQTSVLVYLLAKIGFGTVRTGLSKFAKNLPKAKRTMSHRFFLKDDRGEVQTVS